MSKKIEELTVQKFERRCPYCDQIISYDRLELKAGENPIQCPSCQRTFIRIIPNEKKGRTMNKSAVSKRKEKADR